MPSTVPAEQTTEEQTTTFLELKQAFLRAAGITDTTLVQFFEQGFLSAADLIPHTGEEAAEKLVAALRTFGEVIYHYRNSFFSGQAPVPLFLLELLDRKDGSAPDFEVFAKEFSVFCQEKIHAQKITFKDLQSWACSILYNYLDVEVFPDYGKGGPLDGASESWQDITDFINNTLAAKVTLENDPRWPYKQATLTLIEAMGNAARCFRLHETMPIIHGYVSGVYQLKGDTRHEHIHALAEGINHIVLERLAQLRSPGQDVAFHS